MKQLSIFLLVLFTQQAAANIITLQSIDISTQFALNNGQSFSLYWDANAVGDNTPRVSSLNEFSYFRTGKNTLNLLTVELSGFTENTNMDLFAGLDAHYGIEAYLNGTNVFAQYRDFWWQRNWQHSAVIRLQNLVLLSGVNLIELYWAERCCDGPNSVKFAFDNGTPEYLGNIALSKATTVPVPTSLAIWVLGLFILFTTTRCRNLKKPGRAV